VKSTYQTTIEDWLIQIRNENNDAKMVATQKLFDMLDRELKASGKRFKSLKGLLL
jgi:hypothetical protein